MAQRIFTIGGIQVKFNVEPYPIQKVYMEKVIKSVEERKTAVLESPTGTGKTLSLLCSTLACIENQKTNIANESDFEIPKVIYATRTHQQIKQAMTELKNSPYCNVNAAVLGSRDQLCLHPNLQKISNYQKIDRCKSLRENKACDFYQNFNEQVFDNQSNSILDIEDLHEIGKKKECCPYFMSLKRIEQADIIFMPYNYLFDSDIQKQIEIENKLENAIIILDEAHNIPNVCTESTSASIDVFKALEEIENIDRRLRDNVLFDSNIFSNLTPISNELMEFLGNLRSIDIYYKNALDGGELELYLEPLDDNIIEKLDCLIQYFESRTSEVNGNVRKADGLRCMKQFLNISLPIFRKHDLNYINRSYKVYSHFEEGRTKLHFLCLSPSFGIDNLLNQNVRCLIMTSSSLAPLDTFIKEFQFRVPIEIREEFPHIIRPEQFFAKSLSFGPSLLPYWDITEKYDSKGDNRDNEKYMYSVGISIIEFSQCIPGGILVFFPTYAMIDKFTDCWKREHLLTLQSGLNEVRFMGEKLVFVEPKNNQDLKGCLDGYRTSIDNPKSKGAIFLAVARGKVSEGLNFTDAYGRGVIFIGFPLPPCSDPKVFLKRKYLDDYRNSELGISGYDWYNLEACKAVNQSIGRIIRHKNDYGAILLCDYRFKSYGNYLSQWVRSHLEEKPFYPVKCELWNFFLNAHNMNLPVPNTQPVDDREDGPIAGPSGYVIESGESDIVETNAPNATPELLNDSEGFYDYDAEEDEPIAGPSGDVIASIESGIGEIIAPIATPELLNDSEGFYDYDAEEDEPVARPSGDVIGSEDISASAVDSAYGSGRTQRKRKFEE